MESCEDGERGSGDEGGGRGGGGATGGRGTFESSPIATADMLGTVLLWAFLLICCSCFCCCRGSKDPARAVLLADDDKYVHMKVRDEKNTKVNQAVERVRKFMRSSNLAFAFEFVCMVVFLLYLDIGLDFLEAPVNFLRLHKSPEPGPRRLCSFQIII